MALRSTWASSVLSMLFRSNVDDEYNFVLQISLPTSLFEALKLESRTSKAALQCSSVLTDHFMAIHWSLCQKPQSGHNAALCFDPQDNGVHEG